MKMSGFQLEQSADAFDLGVRMPALTKPFCISAPGSARSVMPSLAA
jgi:hypothetical protein